MTHSEIREKFLKFFKQKNHKIVPSSSLLPTDPSVLFTTAGMQQFKLYYTGQANAIKDFGSLNTVSIQKSVRTSDIDTVGDESHLTFFEMLGNFSFGGYWKKEAIEYAYEFITKELGLKIDYVSVFGGKPFDFAQGKSGGVPPDLESEKIWKSLDPKIEVKKANIEDNFWGPTGSEGPCGPTTEIYVNPSTDGSGQAVEIWNIVFNQFYYKGNREQLLKETDSGKFDNLKTAGIDTGMGLERLAMVVQKKNNIFETDLSEPILNLIPKELDLKIRRIIADHSRTIAFLISDGVRPSNKEQGYILRRLMRRVINYVSKSDIALMHNIFAKIIEIYGQYYSNLNAGVVIHEFDQEKDRFGKTLYRGTKELKIMAAIDAAEAFKLYESYGLPFEIIKDVAGEKAKNLTREAFDQEFKKHQEKSRAGAEKKFGGHGLLLDTGELRAGNEEELKKATRLHTATHLLHASLRKVLGPEVKQAGSDITAERLRFDFTFPRKMTVEEVKKVENLANEAVEKNYQVTKKEMSYEEAIESGALAFFKLKYPNRVNVYTIGVPGGRPSGKGGRPSDRESFSRELCGGPHVTHTAEIGKIKIIKEESISAGVRRIRAAIID